VAEVVGEPAVAATVNDSLQALGFAVSADGVHPKFQTTDLDALADTVEDTLGGPLGAPPDAPLDIRHGSRRGEVELRRKLVALRERVGRLLAGMGGVGGPEVDTDGDYTFTFQTTRVWIAPRALPGGLLVVRVLAVTNVDIEPTPQLGLFLAETNFLLPFGRLSLDPRQRAVWFEESLLGEHFADEELRVVVKIVASTADQLDERIARLFGGRVFNPPGKAGAPEERPAEKPGEGGYL
jgi:hypothetical protein